MSEVFTSAGTKYYIGALPETYDQSNMEAVEYSELGEVVDGGSFGRVYNVVNHNPLGDRRTVKRKGSYNDGSINLQLAISEDDDGQDMAEEALDSDDSYAIKCVLQTGTAYYFSAQVTSFTVNIGTADSIAGANINLEIDDDIYKVAAEES